MMTLHLQIIYLFVLAIPISCIAWTVTHEEIFKEPREFCVKRSKACRNIVERKFFYLFTCEYCFSHYIVVIFLFITHYKLLYEDWRGYLIGGFSLVWMANVYISLFNRVRVVLKNDKLDANLKEEELKKTGDDGGAGK